MTHTAKTLKLTPDWDLEIDENGNLAMLDGVDAILQNVSNEVRLFWHDAYFRYEGGIKWFSDVLGKPLQEAVLRDRLRTTALSVPGVVSVDNVVIEAIDEETRSLHGKIYVTTEAGNGVSDF